ncbi:MAG: hypothetical protein FJ214_02370 [Ignavibacteria bacterium]|nr:hypothetical protein [Ignavibacteria bacterium]
MMLQLKRLKISFFVLLLINTQSFGQVNPGARQIALSHSDIAFSEEVFSLFNNPAGLAYLINREVGLFYSPAPFGVKELSSGFGAYVEPTSIGSFSGGFMIYGFDLYKETKILFGFGRKITNTFSVGLSAVYRNISIINYGSKGNLSFNLGSSLILLEMVSIGASIENATNSTVGNEENQLPVVFNSGIGIKILNDFKTFMAIRKELNYDLSIMLGAEYNIFDFLQLRIGTATEPNTFSGGFGLKFNFLTAEYAVLSHPDLDLTHQFGLVIQLKNE